MVNLRSVDLNLLTIFEAVYEERSQVRAAERLNMTQPAISNALNRLRTLLGDRLFMGRAKGLVATTKADSFYQSIHSALDTIRAEIESQEYFDPASAQQTFVVTISYGSGALLGLPLYRHIRALAPQAKLIIRSVDPGEEIPSLLREQRIDLAFHHALLEDDCLVQQPYAAFDSVIVARAGHPRIASAVKDPEHLLEEEFVKVHDASQGIAHNLQPLIERFHSRIVLEVPNTTLLPLAVSQSDLIAVMSSQLVELVGELYGLKAYPPPMPVPPVPIYLIWHPTRRDDPAHRWLREQCLAVAEELQSNRSAIDG